MASLSGDLLKGNDHNFLVETSPKQEAQEQPILRQMHDPIYVLKAAG
jgi:hypothetical protein